MGLPARGDSSETTDVGTRALMFRVLGPLEVTSGDESLRLGGAKQRSVLAILILNANRVVSVDRLIRSIWAESAPNDATGIIHVYISSLRRILNPGRELGLRVIVRRDPGYQLAVEPHQVDLLCFEQLLEDASRSARANRLEQAEDQYRRALALWRGQALADLISHPLSPAVTLRLEERRDAAEEALFDVGLRRGRHRELVADLEAAVRENPSRERLCGLLMTALYRSGRQADALAAYQYVRAELRDRLGIDPSPELRRLELAMLSQDPQLDLPSRPWSGDPYALDGTRTAPNPAARGVAWLELPDGTKVSLEARPLMIGRHGDCDVVIAAGDVSRRHAQIRPSVAGPVLFDLSSTNGTLVNGAPVLHRLLEDGDLISLGSHVLRFRLLERVDPDDRGQRRPGS
jgi:DNA-binding SARP family transcriptional activator